MDAIALRALGDFVGRAPASLVSTLWRSECCFHQFAIFNSLHAPLTNVFNTFGLGLPQEGPLGKALVLCNWRCKSSVCSCNCRVQFVVEGMTTCVPADTVCHDIVGSREYLIDRNSHLAGKGKMVWVLLRI